jgi:hypothetical protein
MLAIKVKSRYEDLILATGYWAPRNNHYLPLQDLLFLANHNLPVLFAGDTNAHHHTLGYNYSNPKGNIIASLITQNKLNHLGPLFPTFYGRGATTPDQIFANSKFHYNHQISEGPLTRSDHTPVVITIATGPIQVPINPRLSLKNANWDSFSEELSDFVPSDLSEATLEEIDTEIERCIRSVKGAMNHSFPLISFRVLPAPFPNEVELDLRRRFDDCRRLFLAGDPTALRTLTRIKSELRDECLRSRREFFNKVTDDILNADHENFWKIFNRYFNSKRKDRKDYIINDNGVKINDSVDVENEFTVHLSRKFRISEEENDAFDAENEIFVENYLEENAHKIRPAPQASYQNLNQHHLLNPITVQDINLALKDMKDRAPGESGIKRKVLQNLPDNMKQCLAAVFTAALSAGYFPDAFKLANIIMIPKNENSRSVSNFRPISLLETYGKLFEKILNLRLQNFLILNNTLRNDQHGFRPQRGTTTAIALATERVAKSIHNGYQTYVVLRDVSAAFDKVWHRGLKYKLCRLNMPDPFTRLLCDFLDNREFKVRYKDHLGPATEIRSGVPQGSILSPTLYNIFLSDIPDPDVDCYQLLYADDITHIITCYYKNRRAMAQAAVRDIGRVNAFERLWKIKTNKNKFKIIPLCQKVTHPIIIDGELYPYSQSGSMLGFLIKPHGYGSHVSSRCGMAKSRLNQLRRFSSLTQKIKLKLYLSLVRPVLEYPPTPLCTMSKFQILKLQRVQNKAVRFILNSDWRDRETAESMHLKLKLPPINQILHTRATNIWKKLFRHFPRDAWDLARPMPGEGQRREHMNFGRAIHIRHQPMPPPLYVT